jgi:type IV secretory pathway VirB3-like protein
LAHSAAGQRQQEYINKGADEHEFLNNPAAFWPVNEVRTFISQHLAYIYIYAVKCICQETNAHFAIYLIFTLLHLMDRLGCERITSFGFNRTARLCRCLKACIWGAALQPVELTDLADPVDLAFGLLSGVLVLRCLRGYVLVWVLGWRL